MADLFQVKMLLYPGANPDSDPSTWGLPADISQYVRRPGGDGGQAISYSGGRGDEASEPDAGRMSLTLDNRDGRFSTDKIDGPYAGLLDTNTPIRMGVVTFTDNLNRVSASGWGAPTENRFGQDWAHAGSLSNWTADGAKAGTIIAAANTQSQARALNGGGRDMDITMTIIPPALATGARFTCGIVARRVDSANLSLIELSFNTDGSLKFEIRRILGGVYSTLASLDPVPSATYTANSRWRIHVQYEGNAVRASVWLESGSEPSAWQLSAEDTVSTGVETGVWFARYTSNTNSGVTPICYVDDYQVIGLEFAGFVSSWPLRWDRKGGNSWAPITADGIIARITQGNYPIQSPLRRHLGSVANISDYWPMEEGSSSKSFAPVRAGGQPAYFSSGVTPAADNELAGGGPAPVVGTSTDFIQGVTNISNNGTGFAALFLFKLASLPAAKMTIARFRTNRGPVPIYDLSVGPTNFITEAKDTDGTVLSSFTNAFGPLNFTEWMAWQLETDNTLSVGNTTWTSLVHQVGDPTFYFQQGTVSGATNSIVNFFRLQGPDGSAFAHVWLGRNTLPFVSNNFSLVSSGYEGELAADRWDRICDEIGLPHTVRTVSTSEAMGIQRESDALSVLRSCVAADYGVMAERGAGLEMVPREARWNPAVEMALSKASGHIADAPEPVRDTQRLRNKWTVSKLDGGSATYIDTASAAKSGLWEDSAMINVESDAVLVNHAGFRVALGTQQRLRWPEIALNFGRTPTLVYQWRKRRYGMRFTVTTGLTQVTGREPDLIMEGFTAELAPDSWTVRMSASQASAWKAGVTDDTGILGRADIESCTVKTAVNSSTLTIPITTATGKLKWDNTAGLWSGGVDLYVGGERVTVTSITNNTGQDQTLNCSVRGVDGYAAAHGVGEEVRLWEPAIVAL